MNRLAGQPRHGILSLLERKSGNVGVELGVARGGFSRRMAESGMFDHFYGVDAYADHHDVEEYKEALRAIGLRANYTLLRMNFGEALDLFEDNSLDFVYIDGYAHAGEDGGETIFAWTSKVRLGGVVSGHDYDRRFPLVMAAVDRLVADTGFELHLTTEPDCGGEYPSWAVIKRSDAPAHAPAAMVAAGRRAAAAFKARRALARPFKWLLARLHEASGGSRSRSARR